MEQTSVACPRVLVNVLKNPERIALKMKKRKEKKRRRGGGGGGKSCERSVRNTDRGGNKNSCRLPLSWAPSSIH